MATFVICHGATSGGWAWQEIKKLLEREGHTVYTPTYTGMGERHHLAHPDIDLHTHIQDVVNVICYEDLYEVVLVGHSYGGTVITGVAEKVPDRLSQLIYLDALILEDGEAIIDLYDPEVVEHLHKMAKMHGDGWRIPRTQDPELDPRYCDQPIKTFTQPITITYKNIYATHNHSE
ncbi:hypothetical protein CathTA2_0298 [Caldalkalibacillus thermarum TA2.A1]|uniref:Alpha/beta fold hydrolase n=1 Tax=Caldalkalibacillus thermarum (strain TA2.A1) TaxID=986075 RepID=F5L3D7_CALTT|nr:alpha/beta fold hydrolase [Caldalkalibacillus thermarum]EGL84152.1 hypothetical protein CathTA2_0298 [Caldalkalibacillus thermarum TA2.A1]QZT33615.1 alpha/beta fold hydrolase [Caldalkalibacillus thermarum TA2.A1]